MNSESRSRVQAAYNIAGSEYDAPRLQDPRGALLSERDRGIFLRMLPPWRDGMQVLEVGAGTGRFTIPALERGYHLTASDINESLLAALREKVSALGAGNRCRIQTENMFDLSFADASLDFLYSLHVIPRLQTFEDQRAAILSLARVVRPGGHLLFNYRNARSIYSRMHRGHMTSPRQIRQILGEAGLEIVEKRGKWLLNRRLINAMPLLCGRAVRGIDRLFECVVPDGAWDVFVLTRKA